MADALAITPHASGEETASGNGSAIDLEKTLRTCVDLALDATVVAGTNPTLIVYVDTSIDGVNGWVQIGQFSQVSAVGSRELIAGKCRRYVRVRWVIGGTDSPAFTFTVSGSAHVLYATPGDLGNSIRAEATADVATESKLRQCLRATTDVESALNSAFGMPIASWGADIRGVTADRAMYYMMMSRGFDPDSPADQLILLSGGIVMADGRKSAAQMFLDSITKGALKPVGIVDQTPEVYEGAGFVISDDPR